MRGGRNKTEKRYRTPPDNTTQVVLRQQECSSVTVVTHIFIGVTVMAGASIFTTPPFAFHKHCANPAARSRRSPVALAVDRFRRGKFSHNTDVSVQPSICLLSFLPSFLQPRGWICRTSTLQARNGGNESGNVIL